MYDFEEGFFVGFEGRVDGFGWWGLNRIFGDDELAVENGREGLLMVDRLGELCELGMVWLEIIKGGGGFMDSMVI